jgi:hypothetical protein
MVVNFRARGISRGARKLTRTPTLIKKQKNIKLLFLLCWFKLCFELKKYKKNKFLKGYTW